MSQPPIVLVDTSAWIEALRKDGRAEVRQRVRQLMISGHAAWNELIALELWNGVRGKAERAMLEKLTEDLTLLSIDAGVWQVANALATQCRAASKTIPTTALLIAAGARRHGALLEHCDKHFDLIPPAE